MPKTTGPAPFCDSISFNSYVNTSGTQSLALPVTDENDHVVVFLVGGSVTVPAGWTDLGVDSLGSESTTPFIAFFNFVDARQYKLGYKVSSGSSFTYSSLGTPGSNLASNIQSHLETDYSNVTVTEFYDSLFIKISDTSEPFAIEVRDEFDKLINHTVQLDSEDENKTIHLYHTSYPVVVNDGTSDHTINSASDFSTVQANTSDLLTYVSGGGGVFDSQTFNTKPEAVVTVHGFYRKLGVGETSVDITLSNFTGSISLAGYKHCDSVTKSAVYKLSTSGTTVQSSFVPDASSELLYAGIYHLTETRASGSGVIRYDDNGVLVMDTLTTDLDAQTLSAAGRAIGYDIEFDSTYSWTNGEVTQSVGDEIIFNSSQAGQNNTEVSVSDLFGLTDTAIFDPLAGVIIVTGADGFDQYGTGDITSVITDSIYWDSASSVTESSGAIDLSSGTLTSNKVQNGKFFRCKITKDLTGLTATELLSWVVDTSNTVKVMAEADGLYLQFNASKYKDRLFTLTGTEFYITLDPTNFVLYVNGQQYINPTAPSITELGAITLKNAEFDHAIFGEAYVGDDGAAAFKITTSHPTSSSVLQGTPSTGTIFGTITDASLSTYTTLDTGELVKLFQPSVAISGTLYDVRMLIHDVGANSLNDWDLVNDSTEVLYNNDHKEGGWASMSLDLHGFDYTDTVSAYGVKANVDGKQLKEFYFQFLETAAVTFERNLSDSLTLTDLAKRRQDQDPTDTITFTDALIAEIEDYQKEVSEALSLSDTISFNRNFTLGVSDSLTVSDEANRQLSESVSESATFSDTISQEIFPVAASSDLVDLVDSVGVSLDLIVHVEDGLVIDEFLNGDHLRTFEFSDTLSVSDTVSVENFEAKRPVDYLNLSDAVTPRNLPLSEVSDTLTFVEELLNSDHETYPLSDSLLVYDVISSQIIPFKRLTDTLNVYDIIEWDRTQSIEVCDSFSFVDVAQRTASESVSDTLSFTDEIGLTSTDDTLVFTDSVSTNAVQKPCWIGENQHVLNKVLTDTLTLTDSFSINRNMTISLSDSLTLKDSAFRIR